MRSSYKKLGEYIRQVDVRNRDLAIDNLLGVSITKQFIPSIANIVGTDLSNYKIVRTGQFAYGPVTSRNGEKISVALLTGNDCIISSSYSVFEVIDNKELCPEYLMLWFNRPEFDRYARYRSHGSVREIFDWEEMCSVELPVPAYGEQLRIVDAYKAIERRIELKKKINDNLDATQQALYKHYFSDYALSEQESLKDTKLGAIPSSWSIGKLSDICELLNGRAYSQDELLLSGKYRVLRVGNFFTQGNWYYSNLELEDNKYCYPDDLLFCWSASFGLYIWNDVKTIYHYHIWKIDFSKTSAIYREYIYLLLKKEVERLKHEGHGSVMAHLTKEGVEKLDILLPSEDVVIDFHSKLLPIIEHQKTIANEIAGLQKLQSSILAQMSS